MKETEKKNTIKVIAKFKPPVKSYENERMQINSSSETVVIDGKEYKFYGIAESTISQEKFYETYIKDHVLNVENGINSTILCYGFTGTGKTYTLFGKEDSQANTTGVINRSIHSIFELVKTNINKNTGINYSINVTMVDVYMERIYDLLDRSNIFVGVSGNSGLIGATKINISTESELIDLIASAVCYRKTQDTRLNKVSSRSHCVIIIEVKKFTNDNIEQCGNLVLVDLAGCERLSNYSAVQEDNISRIIKKTPMAEKLRLSTSISSEINKTLTDESKNINKSIFSLNNVVTACSTGQKYIPYRNSKITMILKNALGGNSKTLVTICCSENINETLMSLQFGLRCNKINNNIKQNTKIKDNRDLIIVKLQSEISDLKDLLEMSKQNLVSLNFSETSKKRYNSLSDELSECDELDENDRFQKNCAEVVDKIFDDLRYMDPDTFSVSGLNDTGVVCEPPTESDQPAPPLETTESTESTESDQPAPLESDEVDEVEQPQTLSEEKKTVEYVDNCWSCVSMKKPLTDSVFTPPVDSTNPNDLNIVAPADPDVIESAASLVVDSTSVDPPLQADEKSIEIVSAPPVQYVDSCWSCTSFKKNKTATKLDSTATRLGATAKSSAGLDATAKSSAGLDATVKSSAGLDATAKSSAGLDATAKSSAGLDATAKSSAGLDATAKSSAGLDATVKSSAGLDATVKSSAGLDATAKSSAGLDATAKSSAGLDATAKSSAGLNATAKSSAGLDATAKSSTEELTNKGLPVDYVDSCWSCTSSKKKFNSTKLLPDNEPEKTSEQLNSTVIELESTHKSNVADELGFTHKSNAANELGSTHKSNATDKLGSTNKSIVDLRSSVNKLN